jgi:hypothetical protein
VGCQIFTAAAGLERIGLKARVSSLPQRKSKEKPAGVERRA